VLVEFIAEQAADRQMLVLTCHEHVARTFEAAGAHVRSFTDPAPLWGRREPRPPAAVDAVPMPPPVAIAAPAPAPVAVAPAPIPDDHGLWPAEAFFFGSAAGAPRGADRDTPAASRPSRRRADRGRRRR
jgi:hypothetical protein